MVTRQKYKNIKIHVDPSGKIQKIEKEENGFWKTIATQKRVFNKLSVNTAIYNSTNF